MFFCLKNCNEFLKKRSKSSPCFPHFEEVQHVKFEIFDADSRKMYKNILSTAKSLGYTTTTLGEIVSREKSLFKKLDGVSTGNIEIRAEEVMVNNDLLTLEFNATKLDKKDFFGKSDPYFTISRQMDDGSYMLCHKSEVIKLSLNPCWYQFSLAVSTICNGDFDKSLLISVYDWNASGKDKLIGCFYTTLTELSAKESIGKKWDLINLKKSKKRKKSNKKYFNSGQMSLLGCDIKKRYTFVDYLQGGMDMNFDIGVHRKKTSTAVLAGPVLSVIVSHTPFYRHRLHPI